MSAKVFLADHAWRDAGFSGSARLAVDGTGAFAQPQAAVEGEPLGRYVVPGMPNLHSHAFQRAMAGLAERSNTGAPASGRSGPQEDSFWTWREVMYAFAGRIGPDDLRAIATQLYVEMLKAGYTQVCEFHYLHHQPDGRPYADPAAMSLALIDAAREAGIGLTLLPTLYMTGGFDGRPLSERQRRFGHDVDAYLRLLERLRALESPLLRVGIALHSLRAVPEDALRAVLASDAARDCPIHIHIAEQIGEVQDCLAIRHARPVDWLLDHVDVDARWCLVHATHLTERETRRLAASGAVAGLCPTTEANLGDGLFPLKPYLDAGGALGIGSDSHISVSPVEELRWLEYGQRLVTRHRNVGASAAVPSTGEVLFAHALAGGARASGAAIGRLDAGRADLLVLDEASPLLAGRDAAHAIDTWIFSGNSNLVRDVMVAGDFVVRGFRHRDEARIAARYRDVVERLAHHPGDT
ncbi:formimidoylglutamate deiminase [Dokdonella sp.]|uniref:formimidoylglutamate deiminase n=1 Tax=Dokdonella sp. TaxID=2291710 RepID=UPI002612B2AC|nr:formimidoylglutamate deiminase [Dokdonella sp.]